MKNSKNIALVVDWLTEGFGGGERVIKAVHDLYPDAPIYTSQYRPRRTLWLKNADVRVGWLNVLPVFLRRFVPFLRSWYFSHLDLSAYDVVISITGAEAKAVATRPDALHVSYMHAPTQYYWTLYDEYMNDPGFGVLNPLMRFGLKCLIGPLRRADFAAAQRPDTIVTISSYMQAEIRKHYGRESTIIWPPVDVQAIRATRSVQPSGAAGFTIAGRQVAWKRIDLAIKAAIELRVPLTVIGDGPERARLQALAEGCRMITFLPSYHQFTDIVDVIRSSSAFLFPSREPFGIVAVEALAAGVPVIAFAEGGAADFIEDGVNGVLFREQTEASLCQAMRRVQASTFDREEIVRSSLKFSAEDFARSLRQLIEETREKS